MLTRVIASLVVMVLWLPGTLSAQGANQSGVVIEVTQPATIVSAGTTRTVANGTAVSSGDVIQTGAKGLVQVQFPDETKMVVGPNSALRIDEALFRPNGRARKLATTAVGGSFRFISGKSRKDVYRLATPLATMGIRGTAFDYTVTRGRSTDLLIFNGLVRFCAAGQRCADVSGSCQAVSIESDGGFDQPTTNAEKRALLAQRFPLLRQQGDLLQPFRASTDGCDTAVPLDLTVVTQAPTRQEGTEDGGNPADGPSDNDGGGGNPAN